MQYEQRQSLFDAELAGTVETYPHDKRIEEIRPGVWVAFDYALANVLIIERNSEWGLGHYCKSNRKIYVVLLLLFIIVLYN